MNAFSSSQGRGLALLLVIGAAASCSPEKKPEPQKASESAVSSAKPVPPAVDAFWKLADESVHDVQKSMRSARLLGQKLDQEASKGGYDEVISLGHLLGGLGHDHVTPEANPPVLAMLDKMTASIDSLTRQASPEELDQASKATESSAESLPPQAQRLFHLLSAKKALNTVRENAVAVGFRAAR